jgi:HEAT repeat protein
LPNSRDLEGKIAAIEGLRADPRNALEPIRKALRDRNSLVCAKAAALCGDLLLRDAIPDLLAAFDRLLKDPARSDPQCWGKIAIVKALKDLGHDDPAVYLSGIAHRLTFVDAESTLRGACALALVGCSLPRETILVHLADVLADPEMRVRIDAARAIAQLPGQDTMLMLRVKAQAGDREPAVIGQCFLSLLGIEPRTSIPFVARFLTAAQEDLRFEAAAALGECPDALAVETLIARWRVERNVEMKRAIVLSLGVSRVPEAREFLDHLCAETDCSPSM